MNTVTKVYDFTLDEDTLTLRIRRQNGRTGIRNQPRLDDIPADYREALREWLGWPTKNPEDLR